MLLISLVLPKIDMVGLTSSLSTTSPRVCVKAINFLQPSLPCSKSYRRTSLRSCSCAIPSSCGAWFGRKPGRSSKRQPLTCKGAKSARKVGRGIRRYGDGLFGVELDDDRRVRIGIGLLIDIREGPPAERATSRYPACLTRREVALLILVIVNLDRTVQVDLLVCNYPSFTPHTTVSGNLPDPGYLESHDDDLARQPHSSISFVPTSHVPSTSTSSSHPSNHLQHQQSGCESPLSYPSLSSLWLQLRLPLTPTNGLMSLSHPAMLRLARTERFTRWTAGAM